MHLDIFKIVGIFLFTIVFTMIGKKIVHRIFPKAKPIWADVLIHALHPPFTLLIWFSALLFCTAIVNQAFFQESIAFSWALQLYKFGTFILLIWALIRLTNEFEKKGKYDPTTLRGIAQVLKIAVLAMGATGLLQLIGIPLSGVIAFGGIGGIAVGFAAKDLLANFFGALTIFLDKPFKIGDWIRSPDQEIEGTVEHIGWRLTRIRTFDQRPLFVPNCVFSTISLENPSRMANRRIKTTLSLRYEDHPKIQFLLPEIERMLKTHPEIDTNRPCFVHLVNFGSYALEVQIYAFTKTIDWLRYQTVQQAIFFKILEIVTQNECRIAYPIEKESLNISS